MVILRLPSRCSHAFGHPAHELQGNAESYFANGEVTGARFCGRTSTKFNKNPAAARVPRSMTDGYPGVSNPPQIQAGLSKLIRLSVAAFFLGKIAAMVGSRIQESLTMCGEIA
jgi:hypothetical protein